MEPIVAANLTIVPISTGLKNESVSVTVIVDDPPGGQHRRIETHGTMRGRPRQQQ